MLLETKNKTKARYDDTCTHTPSGEDSHYPIGLDLPLSPKLGDGGTGTRRIVWLEFL